MATIAPRSTAALPIDWVARVAAVGMLLGMALSWRVWIPLDRTLPVIPVFGETKWGETATPWGSIFLTSVLVSTAFWLLWRPSQIAAVALCLTWPLSCVGDQVRIQPWVYHYWLMLAPLALWGGNFGHATARWRRLVVIAVYFWAGAHKLAPQFRMLYQSLIARWRSGMEGWLAALVDAGAWLIPVAEILLALGLLVSKFRRAAVIGLFLLHGGILCWLYFGWDEPNWVVWPWNFISPTLAALLFWNKAESTARKSETPALVATATGIVAVLCWFMPLLSLAGKWDQYLSFHLYSGHARRMILASPEPPTGRWSILQPYVQPSKTWPGHWQIDFNTWSIQDTNVPLPPEERHYRKVALALAESAPHQLWHLYHDFPNESPLRAAYYSAKDLPPRLTELPPPQIVPQR